MSNPKKEEKLGIAFITTPRFREKHPDEVVDFVATEIWDLCRMFDLYLTGGTYDEVLKILRDVTYNDATFAKVKDAVPVEIDSEDDLDKQWRQPVKANIIRMDLGYPGMIRITNDIIIGRINAVIHLMDWDDVAGKPDTTVLRRQANVHDVPIACDVVTARSMISWWKGRHGRNIPNSELCKAGGRSIQEDVQRTAERLDQLEEGKPAIALIAHDGMKLEMCRFVIEHAKQIVDYDTVLATGTTGKWIKRFLEAAQRSKTEREKIICCLSGPDGGDVQVAWMVVKGICKKVIFFQDPMVSHAHAIDILLFEQALLSPDVEVALAMNPETAVALLEL